MIGRCLLRFREFVNGISNYLLTEGPEGPLLGHQGEETGLQGVCDDDVKQLLEILPVTGRKNNINLRDRCQAAV